MRSAIAVHMRRIRAVHSSPPTADRTGPARRNIGGGLGRVRGRGRRPRQLRSGTYLNAPFYIWVVGAAVIANPALSAPKPIDAPGATDGPGHHASVAAAGGSSQAAPLAPGAMGAANAAAGGQEALRFPRAGLSGDEDDHFAGEGELRAAPAMLGAVGAAAGAGASRRYAVKTLSNDDLLAVAERLGVQTHRRRHPDHPGHG